MFESIGSFFKKIMKPDQKELLVEATSKDAAKERLHIVLMQDRANVSADFLELMKQEIIDVIKKYIVVDEEQIDVRLTNQENDDGTTGAPALYANIPILNIRNDIKSEVLNGGPITIESIDNNPLENQEKSQILNEQSDFQMPSEEVVKQEKTVQEQVSKKEIFADEKIEISEIKELEKKENSADEIEDDEELDDDDVTFDDLLKVAEEEERQKNMASSEQKATTPKKKSASRGRPKKKTTTTTKKTSKTSSTKKAK